MFIVFEGIDGGGKTTLSNLVAKALAESGLRVEHVREEGRYASPIAQSLREFGRDARNLALVPEAELLLLAARESQLFAESTKPALERADVVIADRFFHTAEVLATRGRGLDPPRVRTLLRAASGGVQPDIVFLVDVDPHVARGRRRVAKIKAAGTTPDKGPSRKGLSGTGLQQLLREGYLALAAEEPTRWIVVRNDEESLETVADRLTACALVAAHHGAAAATRLARSLPAGDPLPFPAATTPEEAADAFLAWVDRRATHEPALAAYFLAGLTGRAVDARRRALAPRAPEVVAEGLAGLDDDAAWALRSMLCDAVPRHVARSIRGFAAASPRGRDFRLGLATLAPLEIAGSLSRQDDGEAWALREILFSEVPERVVASLAGIDSPRAWEMRRRLEPQGMPAWAALAQSVAGIDSEEAWEIRESAFGTAPVEAIASIGPLGSERAWAWREKHVQRAPRVVARTLATLDDPRAWTMRSSYVDRCKEMLESVADMDAEAAWELREASGRRWPSTTAKCLGVLRATPRGRELVCSLLASTRGNLSLWKHAASTALSAAAEQPHTAVTPQEA